MNNFKYLVKRGIIRSKNDGEIHFVSAQQVIRLYDVNPKDCYIVTDINSSNGLPLGLITLEPRSDGNYNLKDIEKELINKLEALECDDTTEVKVHIYYESGDVDFVEFDGHNIELIQDNT